MAKQKITISEKITNQFIEALESMSDASGWERPWKKIGGGLAFNATTKNPYRGGNVFMLLFSGNVNGYTSNAWATFKQWKNAGYSVQKGQKGTPIMRACPFEKEVTKADGTVKTEKGIYFKGATVFNGEQVADKDGNPFKIEGSGDDDSIALNDVDSIIADTGADIQHGGDRACYSPVSDTIKMPTQKQFKDAQGYYATMLHELVHWTGHHDRLDRLDLGASFGDESYAFEELVAEIGSTILCAQLGISQADTIDINHVKYVKSWIKVLKDDPNAIMKAAGLAQKAVDWITEGAQQAEQDKAA